VSTPLRLDDIRRAWEAKDPALVDLVVRLAEQPDEPPKTPIRQGALTFDRFLREIQSPSFHRKPRAEQAHYRVEQLKALESPTAEVPLPDRLKLHEILFTLWNDDGLFARTCLLRIIARVRLTYGPWRALKKIFKEAEGRGDTEIYGALSARFDMAYAGGGHQIRGGTLGYLVRRAWRYLRRTGQTLPVAYADTVVDFLTHYTDNTNWYRTWVINHVFFHNSKAYGRGHFTYQATQGDLLKNRAYPDLWTRTPRPLFALLERARCERVREFATAALKTDFRAALRDVEPPWVVRLVGLGSRTVDDFVVWILGNVPRFEQASFRALGLHEAVLRLFDSPSADAQAYAAEYARTHARDLPVAELVRLANNSHPKVRKLASDLLLERDARKDVGLEAWGLLLETDHGHELATGVLRKHFGARELTPEWFKDRLFSPRPNAFKFAEQLLPQIHPLDKLGAGFFVDVLERLGDARHEHVRQQYQWAGRIAPYALKQLERFDLGALDRDFLRRLLLDPLTRNQVTTWINQGKLKVATLGVDFFKLLAFQPSWDTDPWMKALREGDRPWARQLRPDENLENQVLAWMGDVRRFAPPELGFAWLMQLVMRSEERYHDFAVETMIKAFTPADFAPQQAAPAAAAEPVKVDLGGASFVFTGKLARMSRKEAEDKVKAAGGAALSTVTAKLHYLVIGDEGSPLYGQGKKGSKQVKAEELNASGANIKIISETAFLQMLSGRPQQAATADTTLAGARRLWEMATAAGPGDAPLATFARKYIRRHHPDLALQLSDRPVDPGAEIPASFLTFELVEPLFHESRKPLRDFALDLSKWELNRWAPPVEALIRLCEAPYSDVREFISTALLADESPQHKRYRIDPAVLTPSAVYSFCESPDEGTRLLGMELINRSPRLQLPEELFRLTESPDRKVRAFVIRALWSLYRDRGITADWKPSVPREPTVGAKKTPEQLAEEAKQRGEGAPPRPEQLPASPPTLGDFLHRMLFEIPPARLEKSSVEGITVKLRPLPTRKAKLSLVEVMRDLAEEEAGFAGVVLPVLDEFMGSRGKSEHDACLVAVTRIRHTHPELKPVSETAAG
jgi:hypothetical protein